MPGSRRSVMTMSKANCSSSSSARSPLSASNDLEAALGQPLRHQAAQGGLVVDEEQVRRGTGRGLQGANILTQRRPNDQSASSRYSELKSVRRAQWLADAN